VNNPQLDNTAADDVAMERVASEISELARSHAPKTERERQLDDELLSHLRASGLMMAGAPREAGGLELAPGLALACAEEIARGDASAGWCVSIAATSSLLAAYLPPEGRDELFADPRGIAAGIFTPRGRARAVDGGVIVSGRWAYCSGIMHSGVLFAGCFIEGERTSDHAPPRPSSVGMLREELDIIDTWHTLGLRGTGSHDAVADELFIPAARVLCLLDGPVIDRPLYRFPVFGYFALSIAAAALGNARGAIDEFATLAADKVGQGSTRSLAERSATHAVVAEAEASLRGARGLFYEAIDAAWAAAHEDEPVPVALRNDLRLAATHAARTSAEVARVLYDLAGGPAIYDDSPLQRRFRDAYTATAHFQVNAASRELQGRILLGVPADSSMI
jgi:alkylation response protein AidB-like acyl-CoA dehydrogenase